MCQSVSRRFYFFQISRSTIHARHRDGHVTTLTFAKMAAAPHFCVGRDVQCMQSPRLQRLLACELCCRFCSCHRQMVMYRRIIAASLCEVLFVRFSASFCERDERFTGLK